MRARALQPKAPTLARVVAAAWALLACALVAEFSGTLRPCAGRGGVVAAPLAPLAGGTRSPSAPAASTTGNATTAAAALPGPAWHEVDALLRRWPLRHGRQAKPAGAVPADLQLLLIHMTNKNAELHGVPVGIGPVLFRWFAFAHT